MALFQQRHGLNLSDLEGSGTAIMCIGGGRCPGAPWAAPAPSGSLQVPKAELCQGESMQGLAGAIRHVHNPEE